MPRRYFVLRCLNFMALAFLLAGCGGGDKRHPVYPASGKVVFTDGKPLWEGVVEFQPVEPKGLNTMPSATATIGQDGTFKLNTYSHDEPDGAVAGEHRVIVRGPEPPAPDMPGDPMEPPYLEPKYRNFETSGLKFTVSEDETKNNFTIEVEMPEARKKMPNSGKK